MTTTETLLKCAAIIATIIFPVSQRNWKIAMDIYSESEVKKITTTFKIRAAAVCTNLIFSYMRRRFGCYISVVKTFYSKSFERVWENFFKSFPTCPLRSLGRSPGFVFRGCLYLLNHAVGEGFERVFSGFKARCVVLATETGKTSFAPALKSSS